MGNSRDPSGGFRTNKTTTLRLRSVTCHLLWMGFWYACLLSTSSVMWTDNNPASLGASDPWHPWAGNVQRRVDTLPLCKVRELRPWLVRHPTVVHNTFAYRDPVCAAWVIALPRPSGKFYSFRSLIVIFLFWIRRKAHIADFWFQDDESFMNSPQSCSFLFPVSCRLWHRAGVFLSSVVMETATVEWTAYRQPCRRLRHLKAEAVTSDPSALPPTLTLTLLWFLCFTPLPRNLTLVLSLDSSCSPKMIIETPLWPGAM